MKINNSGDLLDALEACDYCLRYDVRSNRITDADGRPKTEQEMDVIVDAMQSQGYAVPTMRTDIGKRIWNAFLARRGYDPLVEWLRSCQDRSEPLNPSTFPHLCWPDRLGAETDLVEWSWWALMVAVVARAFRPPVRWDVVPIIQGPQGCGKSTAVTNLLPARWTNGGFPLSGVKDFDSARKTMEFAEGKAILESSEMVGMRANTREAVKAFLSQDTDRSTRKYAIQAEDVPRRWVIVGTTNDDAPIPYDQSGGRRWIVTRIAGVESDDGARVAQMLHDFRDRLWAGALDEYDRLVAENGTFPQEALSVPSRLQSVHEAHVQANMWRPPASRVVE